MADNLEMKNMRFNLEVVNPTEFAKLMKFTLKKNNIWGNIGSLTLSLFKHNYWSSRIIKLIKFINVKGLEK